MLQLSSITVPLDGSGFAEQALPLAADLARSSSATLRLALVHTPASTWDPGVTFSLFDPDVEVQVREREHAYLEAMAARLGFTLGQLLEDVVLHSFERVEAKDGHNCSATPYTARTFALIEELKRKHGVDYQAHASYGFVEKAP